MEDQLTSQRLEHGLADIQRVNENASLCDCERYSPSARPKFKNGTAALLRLATVPVHVALER
jgi:hypothetical protein